MSGSLPAFDPSHARFPTGVVPCASVVDLLPISHDPECIMRYRDAMERGSRFPPISVIVLGSRYVVADGHKRFCAYQGLGQSEMVVEIWPLRMWLWDQCRQAAGNARKNARIIATSFSDPAAAWRLLLTTLLHWRRVATSLVRLAMGRVR